VCFLIFEAVIFLAVNSATGWEYVGSCFEPLWKGVEALFKEALITNPSKEYSANREISLAIRTSNLKDWRIVILEQVRLVGIFLITCRMCR
jgi:hypothetical protein